MTTVAAGPVAAPPVVAPQVVVYQQSPFQPPLNSKAAIITGYMQIAISVASLAFGIACICLHYFQGYIAVPIWGALGFYLVAGILGVVAGHSKGQNYCTIIACLVMSILAAVTAGVHVIIGSIYTSDYYYYWDDYYSTRFYAVNILTTLVGGMELVVAIIASVFMCRGASCCCGDSPNVNSGAYNVMQPSGLVGNQVIHGYPMLQQHYVGQPQVMCQPQFMAQSQVMGQPQFMGQPQQNVQYMSQAQGQLPA